METHVDSSNVSDVCKKVCKSWSWATNANYCSKGTRIMVGWDANLVDVMILHQTDQVVHTQVMFKLDRKSLFVSFVYAENYYKTRRDLWKNLLAHRMFMRDKPWVIMGDFNSSLFSEDTSVGSSTLNIGDREFRDCVYDLEMFDVNSSGLHYTWTNNQHKKGPILKKIDRIMCNVHCIDMFPNASAFFHPYRVSDHAPSILKLPNVTRDKPKPFKFVNLVAEKDGFMEEVKRIWSTNIDGYRMYQVVRKLKLLKSPLRKLFHKQGNLHEKVKSARKALDMCQMSLDGDPLNENILAQHGRLLQEYKDAVHDEVSFLKQKSKVEWLAVGDSNTKYFHNVVKTKNHLKPYFLC
ncbi:uncharacterized protein LOC110893471 [Helianthus annuus]|uniref:uncharacterized protein LOC110893471 n=1 Tax=Helianthus annuus TaxID=4232 RepID=UPI000B90342E|nr:uncharacterized protein LOC110893471 [Helianthus annuus]